MAKTFKEKLAAALRDMKENNTGSASIPLEEGELPDVSTVDDMIRTILDDRESKPQDNTPVSAENLAAAMEVLKGLLVDGVPIDAYVKAFSHVILVHNEIHAAPTFYTAYHEHTLNFGTAIESIANMKFGEKTFSKAVMDYQNGAIEGMRSQLTESLLNAAPDVFQNLRPKRRTN